MTLEQARKRAKLSQFAMAARLGKTERTWRRWAKGQSKIPAQIMPEVQEILGLTADEIMNFFKPQNKTYKEGA